MKKIILISLALFIFQGHAHNFPITAVVGTAAGLIAAYSVIAYVKFTSLYKGIVQAFRIYNDTRARKEDVVDVQTMEIASRSKDGKIKLHDAFYKYLSPQDQYNIYLHEVSSSHFAGMLAILPFRAWFLRNRVEIPLEPVRPSGSKAPPAPEEYDGIFKGVSDIRSNLEYALWKASLDLEPDVYISRSRAEVIDVKEIEVSKAEIINALS